MVVSKIDAAHRQMFVALRLFFKSDDVLAVHALASNAREIYERHCKAQGIERYFDHVQSAHPHLAGRDIWNILNSARNFLKHEGGSLQDTHEFDDAMNKHLLFYAAHDCQSLCKSDTPLMIQAYVSWFLATEEAFSDPGDSSYDQKAMEIREHLGQLFPGLRTASGVEQKRRWPEVMEATNHAGVRIKSNDPPPLDICQDR